ncbi:MAG TPA: hypothetical protein VEZ49_10530 [Gemmatimonadales bacterium]|nr:hypothetical protein [Gemmatimonadales bacterium]
MLLVLGLLACASRGQHAALGWSLGGEAHVFFAGDRFARDIYRHLTGSAHLTDSLGRRSLVPVQLRRGRPAQVFSASGSTPATLTLVRFHAPRTCGYDGLVTELVLAFSPARGGSQHTPPSHEPVVAMLTEMTFTGGAGAVQPALSRQDALDLLNRVVRRATGEVPLLRPLVLDADQAADAGEVVPLGWSYGVGFRARVLTSRGDTMLVSGVASTDRELRRLRWVTRPREIRLTGGMIPRATSGVRYSLRGSVAGNGVLVLVDEIADVSAGDSRATAIDVESRNIIAAQPLALRCP